MLNILFIRRILTNGGGHHKNKSNFSNRGSFYNKRTISNSGERRRPSLPSMDQYGSNMSSPLLNYETGSTISPTPADILSPSSNFVSPLGGPLSPNVIALPSFDGSLAFRP